MNAIVMRIVGPAHALQSASSLLLAQYANSLLTHLKGHTTTLLLESCLGAIILTNDSHSLMAFVPMEGGGYKTKEEKSHYYSQY